MEPKYTLWDIENDEPLEDHPVTRQQAHDIIATMFHYDYDPTVDERRCEDIPLDELLDLTHLELRPNN